jgi:hypothetical protein
MTEDTQWGRITAGWNDELGTYIARLDVHLGDNGPTAPGASAKEAIANLKEQLTGG